MGITVSISMITYNQEAFIAQAIEGVMMQITDFPIELVIGEDFSTDNTRKICIEYREKYPEKIKLLLRDKNVGMNANLADVFSSCEGKFIAFCEGDDYWTDPYKLQKQVDFLEANEDVGLVYTDIDVYYQNTGHVQSAVFQNGLSLVDIDNPINSSGYLGNATWVFRRKLLESLSVFDVCKDVALQMFYEFSQYSKIQFLPDVTGVYRISTGTASRPTDEFRNYQYYKGIFYLQKRFLDKYNIKNMASDSVLMNSVINLLPHAIRFQDDELVLEATTFFKSRDLSIDSYIEVCQKLLEAENDLKSVHAATSYRIGKLLLQPLKFLRKASGLDKYK